MNLSGQYFYYNGKSSARYGLKIMHLDTERISQLSGEMEYQVSYSRYARKFRVNGVNYSDSPAEFDVEFISEAPIPVEKKREITRWLFNRANPSRLYADIHKDDTRQMVGGVLKREYLECVFYGANEIRFADGLHGWGAKMLVMSPMAHQEEVTQTILLGNGPGGTNTLFQSLYVDTDIDDYVYPYMEIRMGEPSSRQIVSLKNTADNDREFCLSDFNQANITVDNGIGTVTDDAGQSLYSHLVGRRFLRLVPGYNTIYGTIENPTGGTVKFTWSNERWFV